MLLSYPPKHNLSDTHLAVSALKLAVLQYPFCNATFDPPKHTPPSKQGKQSKGSKV